MQSPSAQIGEALHPLSVRLHRMNGKCVHASAMRLDGSGLGIGSDSVALSLSAALHVAPRHASIFRETGEWFIAPACTKMILAVNGQKMLPEERHPLRAGDCIEIGFASLMVELAEQDDAYTDTGRIEATDAPSESVEAYPTSESMAFSAPLSLSPEQSERPEIPPAKPETRSDADLLRELLDADTRASNGNHALQYVSVDPLKAMLHISDEQSDQTNPLSPHPRDILTQLMEESAQVLHSPERVSRSPDTFAAPQPPAQKESPFLKSQAASLEEILHGPLSIDDVLESLRQRHPEKISVDPLAEMLDQLDRVPDPLRLLAGKENPPPREPELAPILRRSHLAVGMNTPYPSSGGNSEFPPLRELPSDWQSSESEQGETS